MRSFWQRSGARDAAGFDVAHGGPAEEAAVLAIELAGAFIADFKGGAGGIQSFIEHPLPGYVQAKLLLILKRAHCGQRTELMMQSRYAHARHGGEFLNAQRLSVVAPEPLDYLGGAMALLAERCDGAKMLSLRAAQQPVDDFTLDEIAEEGNVLRRIEKVNKAGSRLEKLERSDADSHGACIGALPAEVKLRLRVDFANRRPLKLENHTKHGHFFRRRGYLAENGQIDRGEQEVAAVALVCCFANVDALLPLHKDNQAGLVS